MIAGNDAELLPSLQQIVSTWGLRRTRSTAGCAIAGCRRSTCGCKRRQTTPRRLADWLAGQPGVSRVVYPGRADHPDHAIAEAALGHAIRQHALLRAGRRPRGGQPVHAAGNRHSVQPIARASRHDDQSPGHNFAPLREPGREATAGDHGRTDPPVGRGRASSSRSETRNGEGTIARLSCPAGLECQVTPNLSRPMRIDLYGMTFDGPGVTYYLWSPWRCTAPGAPALRIDQGVAERRIRKGPRRAAPAHHGREGLQGVDPDGRARTQGMAGRGQRQRDRPASVAMDGRGRLRPARLRSCRRKGIHLGVPAAQPGPGQSGRGRAGRGHRSERVRLPRLAGRRGRPDEWRNDDEHRGGGRCGDRDQVASRRRSGRRSSRTTTRKARSRNWPTSRATA